MLTGADVMALTSSLVVGVKAPLECWPIAVDRVRYVGEPVAIVVASDRYRAEDAVDLIEMRYRPLPAVVDPVAAATADLPLLHRRSTATSSASARFVTATRSARSRKPRIASASTSATRATPARRSKPTASSPKYDAGEDAYDVLANFQGPFSLHPVMARALKVPGNRSLLHRSDNRAPCCGGSGAFRSARTRSPTADAWAELRQREVSQAGQVGSRPNCPS